ncbi:MAG: GTPase Era, partial [Pseudopedobacter saltans]
AEQVLAADQFFEKQPYCSSVINISALTQDNIDALIKLIVKLLPNGAPFYSEDDLTDLPTKFFVAEMIREKVYELYGDEIPYHTAILVNEFKEKDTLTKIQADIIVQRDTQKGILLGGGGQMIKKLGTMAREDIEKFLDRKVFLQLFVKVRPKWRDNDLQLKEFGYK